jgi:hypothetical protein
MALTIPKVQGDFIFSYGKQTTWGTALTATGVGIACDDLEIVPGANMHQIKRGYGARGIHEAGMFANTDGVLSSAKFSCALDSGIATASTAVDLLSAAMPAYTPYAAATNVWTIFTQNGAAGAGPAAAGTGMPTPKADNTGWFATLTRNSPTASDSVQIKDAIMRNLKLSIHPTNNNGLLWAETDWIGQGYARGAAAITAVTQSNLTAPYRWAAIQNTTSGAMYDTLDLSPAFLSAEWNITCGAHYISDAPGKGIIYPEWNVTGSFTCSPTANTETMKGYITSRVVNLGKTFKVGFGDGTVTTAGEMNLLCNCYLTKFTENFKDGEEITFDFQGCWGGAALVNPPFQAVLFVATS